MRHPSRSLPRRTLVAAVLLAHAVVAPAAGAATSDYRLEPEASTVGFATDFGDGKITGRMPVARADLQIDFDSVANTTVAVTLDVSHAQASFPFAAEAMKGPQVLDAGTWPTIRFVSTRVRAEGDGARVDGRLTIRGVTRPATLHAQIYRQAGYVPGDRSHLTIRLTGAVQRSAFGATGWANLVGDEVRLDILARIARVE